MRSFRPYELITSGLLALSLLFFPPAHGADLVTKAPNKYLAYPVGCGFYWGGAASGSGGGSTTSSTSGVQVLAGDIGILGGYTCPIGTQSFWFAEAIFSVSKVNGSDSTGGLSLSGAASFEQRVGFGAPWSTVQQLISAIPSLGGVALPSIPTLPGNLTAGATNPYIFAGMNERDISAQVLLGTGQAWLVSAEIGFGTLTRLSNGMVLDTWVKYQPSSTRLKIGPTNNFQTGDFVGVGMALKL